MTGRDVFFAIVELLGVACIATAIGLFGGAQYGFLIAGVVFLLVSWLEASR